MGAYHHAKPLGGHCGYIDGPKLGSCKSAPGAEAFRGKIVRNNHEYLAAESNVTIVPRKHRKTEDEAG